MPCRLSKEEIVTLRVSGQKGWKKTEIAEALGVSEGTVRYHLRRMAQGKEDGRGNKEPKAVTVSGWISAWVEARREGRRPVNVQELYEGLVEEVGYAGSYKSVVRYMRDVYGKPRIRTYRRVETPPGAQTQTDWGEFPRVNVGEGPEPLSAFIMSLSHSRMPAVIWRRGKEQLSWQESHNDAYRWLGGVAAVNGIDNVRTAMAEEAGAWGRINPVYRTYARTVGFHIDACPPRQANAKGKAEAKVRLARLRLDPQGREHDGLAGLQAWSDRRLLRWAAQAICPATGRTVLESWEEETRFLRQAERLPTPFDVVVNRPVSRDCLVQFENHAYCVPFRYAGRLVEVRGYAGTVQIWAEGQLLREYPRGTQERLLLDRTCYEGEATDRVLPPVPLGRRGQRLEEILQMPVQQRPIDLYAALMEVAR